MSQMNREPPIRVLLAMDRLGYDGGRFHGAGRLLVDWSQALRERGVAVTTVIMRSSGIFDEDAHGPITLLGRGRFDPRAIVDFHRLIRDRDIQVAHLQGFGSLTFGRIAARLAGIPVVAHVHADHRAETGGYPWYVQVADRLLAPLADRCIAVSGATARFAISAQGFRPENVTVWHNPVDLEQYLPATPAERREARAELGFAEGDRVVATVARLDRVKGVDLLARAWPAVVARVPEARLLLVGYGDLLDEIRSLLDAADVLDTVTFAGYRQDVWHVLHAVDVLALPSRSEGMPLAALEALASGVPVVARAVGGVPELVRDGENGVLVPMDVEALASALADLLSDDRRRRHLASRARASVLDLELSDYAARLEGLYREMLRLPALGVANDAEPDGPAPRAASG